METNKKHDLHKKINIGLFVVLGIIFFTLWYTTTPHKDSKNIESVIGTQQVEIISLKNEVNILKEKEYEYDSVQNNNLNRENQCKKIVLSENTQQTWGLNSTPYVSHFNSEMDKCLILLEMGPKDKSTTLFTLIDAESNKTYASYWYKGSNFFFGCKYSGKTTLNTDVCKNQDDFVGSYIELQDWENFIKPFMNN